jgi:tRNA 2-thiouridine synthesizing protein C
MTTKNKKSLLVVVRHSPYGSSLARTALEVALSSATFDQDVGLLFMGDGVFHLLPEQDSSAIGVRNIARLIASFPLYDLKSLFADKAALIQYGLARQELPQNLQQMDDNAMADLLNHFDHILSF